MKRILSLLLIAGLFSACQKDESPFDKGPDERINETLASYEQALVSSPAGWNATIITGTGGLFNFHFRFNASNRVFMFSDFNQETAGTEKESSYRLKSLQQPVLMFDTYSYIHLLGDPTGSVNGGQNGEGLKVDFEYSLDTLYADSIILTGRFYGTRLKLIKSDQADLDAWQNGIWENNLAFLNISEILEYFKRFSHAGVTYEMLIDETSRTILFHWVSGGTLRTFVTSYYFDNTGLVLQEPLVNGNTTITGFDHFDWNDNNKTLDMQVNGQDATIAGATAPLRTDLGAPRRWWEAAANAGSYWISPTGFHVNGVDDAYHVTEVPNYYFTIFWPAYGRTQDNVVVDILGFVTQEIGGLALNIAAGYRPPNFTSDGRVVFPFLDVLTDVPPEAKDAFEKTYQKFSEAEGFYFVQTGASSYDMVAASDARSWISWVR
ncbi:DUF4302 domain-containing protein [Flavihumibacter petaseus]|uniref:DUF4302 domain-containing protein n=1 Tax=Flavihumibacter petaseus NBRC 106054 TaxID=1220578 RepID=A0A0E9N3J9_9BACT|nr:DUF4302 domain-containing protein [Flavihumibacter petaseus]GAO43930.1 hypothetical protein FPE01S_02_10360 [Flavihumibacter petaseus NBRC 106054]